MLKTFVRDWLLPPGIDRLLANSPSPVKKLWGTGNQFDLAGLTPLRATGKTAAGLEELLVASYGEIVWIDTDKVRLWGRALSWQQNHLVRYFKEGFPTYRKFFELHQPNNQFEAIMLDPAQVGAFSPVQPPIRRFPWSYEIMWRGEDGWDGSHGTQAHGPISETKLLFERKRLDKVRASIEKHGFGILDDYDFIHFGELLVDDSNPGLVDYRVSLHGGIHRSSFLAHLGWPLIPMISAQGVASREVRLSSLPHWPGVLDGTFSENAARAYFLAHFRDPSERLLPGW